MDFFTGFILLVLWVHSILTYLDASYNPAYGYKRSEFMLNRVKCEILFSILILVMRMR